MAVMLSTAFARVAWLACGALRCTRTRRAALFRRAVGAGLSHPPRLASPMPAA